jgi:hypothetical protein
MDKRDILLRRCGDCRAAVDRERNKDRRLFRTGLCDREPRRVQNGRSDRKAGQDALERAQEERLAQATSCSSTGAEERPEQTCNVSILSATTACSAAVSARDCPEQHFDASAGGTSVPSGAQYSACSTTPLVLAREKSTVLVQLRPFVVSRTALSHCVRQALPTKLAAPLHAYPPGVA